MRKIITILIFCLNFELVFGQEFPIAVGSDTTFAMSANFDGTNYMVAIKGDNQSIDNVTAQFVSTSGTLIGSRIFIGSNVSSMSVLSAFDGVNYLLIWSSNNGNIVGQFLSPNGSLVGSSIIIASNAEDIEDLIFNGSEFLVCYSKVIGLNESLLGQRISTSGNLLGSSFSITTTRVGDVSLGFDGNNYMVAYTHRYYNPTQQDLAIRFISSTGLLLGSELTIASGVFRRDNPTSLAFDGTNYLLAYHEQDTSAHQWFAYGVIIDTTGVVQNNFMICDSSLHPFIPMVTFGDNKYLITWSQLTNGSLMGQWYNTLGNSISSPFVIFNNLNNKFPIGRTLYLNNTFTAIATRLDTNFTDGDVYGKFINSPTGILYNQFHNEVIIYPNPANDFVGIDVSNYSNLLFKIYSISGEFIKTEVVNNKQQQIFIGDLSNGIYIVEVSSRERTQKQKLIIQR